MDVNTYTAFLAVAEEASFSRAAQRLHLTQPAVSKRIAALEDDLGAALFDRIGRQVILTEAGRALLPLAQRILQDVRETRQVIANLRGEVSGPLPLVTSHHIGLRRLPGILRDFTRQYPDVRLDLAFMDSENACRAIEKGDFELGVVTLPVNPPAHLRLTPIWDDPLVIAVGQEHPLAHRDRVALEELGRHSAILPALGTYTRTLIEAPIVRRHGSLDVILETNYLETIRMMVSIGLGWSALPKNMIEPDLVTVPVEGLELTRTLGLVQHAERSLSNASRAFVHMLERE